MEKLSNTLAVYCFEDRKLDSKFEKWLTSNGFKKNSYSLGFRIPYLFKVDLFRQKYETPPPGIASASVYRNHIITVDEFFIIYERLKLKYLGRKRLPKSEYFILKNLAELTDDIYDKYDGLKFYQMPGEPVLTEAEVEEQSKAKVKEIYEYLLDKYGDDPEYLNEIEKFKKENGDTAVFAWMVFANTIFL